MFYNKKVHTELQTAFLRDSNCIFASLKLHSTNGIEKNIFLQHSIHSGTINVVLL